MSETEQPKLDPLQRDEALLQQIKLRLPELQKILTDLEGHWGYEDSIYRFYHHSFKVYYLQSSTLEVVGHFRGILEAVRTELNIQEPKPDAPKYEQYRYQRYTHLAGDFEEIVKSGTGITFKLEHNANWLTVTRPIVEAFFHAHYMLKQMVKYGMELEHAVSFLPSGWASVLYLFNMR